MNSKTFRTKWFVYSIIGVMGTGAGLSMAVEAGFAKHNGEPWFWYGTLALIIFNGGLSLFADGQTNRIKWLKSVNKL